MEIQFIENIEEEIIDDSSLESARVFEISQADELVEKINIDVAEEKGFIQESQPDDVIAEYGAGKWEKTFNEETTGRFDFTRGEMMSIDGTQSITEQIRQNADEVHVAAHEYIIDAWRKSGGDPQLISYTEELEGRTTLHVTRTWVEDDWRIVSETWSKVLSEQEAIVDSDAEVFEFNVDDGYLVEDRQEEIISNEDFVLNAQQVEAKAENYLGVTRDQEDNKDVVRSSEREDVVFAAPSVEFSVNNVFEEETSVPFVEISQEAIAEPLEETPLQEAPLREIFIHKEKIITEPVAQIEPVELVDEPILETFGKHPVPELQAIEIVDFVDALETEEIPVSIVKTDGETVAVTSPIESAPARRTETVIEQEYSVEQREQLETFGITLEIEDEQSVTVQESMVTVSELPREALMEIAKNVDSVHDSEIIIEEPAITIVEEESELVKNQQEKFVIEQQELTGHKEDVVASANRLQENKEETTKLVVRPRIMRANEPIIVLSEIRSQVVVEAKEEVVVNEKEAVVIEQIVEKNMVEEITLQKGKESPAVTATTQEKVIIEAKQNVQEKPSVQEESSVQEKLNTQESVVKITKPSEIVSKNELVENTQIKISTRRSNVTANARPIVIRLPKDKNSKVNGAELVRSLLSFKPVDTKEEESVRTPLFKEEAPEFELAA